MYQTKQKKHLVEFLKNNISKQLSINEIISNVCPDGIGKSTIYRLISQMTKSGTLLKLRGEDAKSILYQYAGDGTQCSNHFHLKCENCGTLIHLDCDHIEKISKHINNEHHFTVNMKKSVLYGLCSSCNEKSKEN